MYYLPADDRDISTAVRDLLSECSALLGTDVRLENDTANPLFWSVWMSQGVDLVLIGAGSSPDEAIAEALEQARRWAEAPAV